jgi:hypothetical protein
MHAYSTVSKHTACVHTIIPDAVQIDNKINPNGGFEKPTGNRKIPQEATESHLKSFYLSLKGIILVSLLS